MIVFRERGDYLDFCRLVTGEDKDDTAGLYMPTYRLLLVSSRDTGKKYGETLWESTRHVLFHEAFHQYIDYFVEDCPSWLNEGLAEFFSTAEDDPQTKGLVLGKVKKEPIGSEGMTSYQEIIGAFKPTARFPPYALKEFIRISQSEYYAAAEKDKQLHQAKMGANYAQGWAFCYFLVWGYGKNGAKGRKVVIDYIKALKDGKENDEAIGEAFKEFKTDGDWEKLEKGWRAFFQTL